MTRRSQRKTIEQNKELFEAVWFVDGYRVLTYGNGTRTEIMIMHETLQARHNVPVALYTIPKDEADKMGSGIDCENHQNLFMEKVNAFRAPSHLALLEQMRI